MDYGVVILAGGKSSRMGTPKHRLALNGTRFLDKLAFELSHFPELLVSVDDEQKHPEIIYPMVSDSIAGCGPMGGLHAALKSSRCGALVTVPCDVPLFSNTLAQQLCAALDEQTDAVITMTQDGREHPLCGVYKKSCLTVLEQCLQQKNYRMRDALAKLKVKVYQAGKDSWRLCNVNTQQELQGIRRYTQIPDCLAVCGWKNAGKTTLIEALLPLLIQKGFQAAVIKHDGHSFAPDVPGTDSYRFFQAGAESTLIYDDRKYVLARQKSMIDEEAVRLVNKADLVLIEGLKRSSYPKLEIVRTENGQMPIPGLRGRLAYVSSGKLSVELPVFKPDDTETIAAFIQEAYESGRLKERWEEEGRCMKCIKADDRKKDGKMYESG